MAVRPPSALINFGQVLMHIGILQAVVNVIGYMIGFFVAAIGAKSGASGATLQGIALVLILVIGTLVAITAFFIFGLRVDTSIRWQHLLFVALGTTILTLLVNAIIEQLPITAAAIVFAFIQTFLAMGIGGGLSMLFRPNRPPQQFVPQAGAPQYPYGAWPNAPQYPQAGAPQNASQYPPQGAPWYPSAPGGPAQPGYGQQPPQYPPQPPAGWGQQPSAQQPMYPVPQRPPNQQQDNQDNR